MLPHFQLLVFEWLMEILICCYCWLLSLLFDLSCSSWSSITPPCHYVTIISSLASAWLSWDFWLVLISDLFVLLTCQVSSWSSYPGLSFGLVDCKWSVGELLADLTVVNTVLVIRVVSCSFVPHVLIHSTLAMGTMWKYLYLLLFNAHSHLAITSLFLCCLFCRWQYDQKWRLSDIVIDFVFLF